MLLYVIFHASSCFCLHNFVQWSSHGWCFFVVDIVVLEHQHGIQEGRLWLNHQEFQLFWSKKSCTSWAISYKDAPYQLVRWIFSINISIVSTCFLFMLFFSHPMCLAWSKLCPLAQRGGFLSVLNLTPTLRGSRFNEGVPEWVFMIDSDWWGFHRFSILQLDLCFSKLKMFWEMFVFFEECSPFTHPWGFDLHQFFSANIPKSLAYEFAFVRRWDVFNIVGNIDCRCFWENILLWNCQAHNMFMEVVTLDCKSPSHLQQHHTSVTVHEFQICS